MAGSYRHCLNDDGSFAFHRIKSQGDAHESLEMMHFMIQYLGANEETIRDAEVAYYRYFSGEVSAPIWVPMTDYPF